ncbi:MAG TPA: hypothetical protein VGC87_17000 [Pyrinomonadaceae bacterium]|jgi:hypothetical protein
MRLKRRTGVSALLVAALVAASFAVLSSGVAPRASLLATLSASAQSNASLFVGTWRGKRNPDDMADYAIRLSMDGGKLTGEALDVGKRQDIDKKNQKLASPRKVRESFVKLQSVSVDGTTLSFKVKDGTGHSQDATMKLVSDNEALVEFVGQRRFPNQPTTTENFSIRLKRQ